MGGSFGIVRRHDKFRGVGLGNKLWRCNFGVSSELVLVQLALYSFQATLEVIIRLLDDLASDGLNLVVLDVVTRLHLRLELLEARLQLVLLGLQGLWYVLGLHVRGLG